MLAKELTQDQIGELADQLGMNAAELESQLDDASQSAKPVILDQQSVGRVSRIDAIQQQQMAMANREQSVLLLQQVSAALQRVNSGEYGFCLECGESIGFARLEAQPHTPNCLDCQSRIEQRL